MLGELGLTSSIIGNKCVDEWEIISLNKAGCESSIWDVLVLRNLFVRVDREVVNVHSKKIARYLAGQNCDKCGLNMRLCDI